MSNPVIDNIKKFLIEEQRPVSAVQLAQRFLHLDPPNAGIANQIIAGLLNSPPFNENDGMWTVEAAVPSQEFAFLCCKVFPETCSVHQLKFIYCAVFSNGRFEKARQFIVDYQNENLQHLSEQLLDFIGDLPLLFDGFGNQRTAFSWLLSQSSMLDAERSVFSLCKIVKKIYPETSITSASDLSAALNEIYVTDNPASQFESFQAQVHRVVELLQDKNIVTIAALHDYLARDITAVDLDRYAFDDSFIKELPLSPGVYIMKNKKDEVIYVGKAKKLKQRVSSYFSGVELLDKKLESIRDELYDIDIVETGSELLALLSEYDLIQKYDPPLNRQFDVHSRTGVTKERYPRILFLPAPDGNVSVLYFNPNGLFKITTEDKESMLDKNIKANIKAVFNNETHSPDQIAHVEIITSWLLKNTDNVSSLDMRRIASTGEAVRLVKQHIRYFDPLEKQIFQ